MSHNRAKADIKGEDNPIGKFLTAFQRKMLQKSLQNDLSESYRQRIEIMLLADQGKSQTEICQTLGCCPATARHWMHVVRSGMAHQWQESAIGRPKVANEEYLERLKELVTRSPRDYGYPFGRWTAQWLSKHLDKELGISVSDRNISLLLKKMGLSTRGTESVEKVMSKETTRITIGDLQSSSEPNLSCSLNINTSNYSDLEV
ncbi:MAG: transposase [Nostoc sp. DedVER02]|uniref:helix-turn-helix domain-containing protein n=1 Tax=unclassified Nostoc TaxID=2593658 RepID=UPI002AD23595|nr:MULTISPECIES: helix-turn-helix domain-containing protein [unclassified Nostoc]MDZ7989063.1 helix-turn-helix domain-containing protein [Nostoc sp. DedVER02]MDZ8111609.1 helix-turn-helix domain-containing protein [Nostoc sp. DedVER01b]